MKPVEFLCMLLPLCAVQGDNLDDLKSQIHSLKSSTEDAVKELTHLQTSLQGGTERRLDYGKLKTTKEINNIVNSALKEIRVAVNAANAQGKKAESCYENADRTLKNVTRNSTFELLKCERNALEVIVPTIRTIGSGIHFGESIMNELDQMFLLCYDGNPKHHANCINEKLPTARTTVNSLKSTVVSIKRREKTASINAYNSGKNCYAKVQKNVESAESNSMMAASKCVKNAK